MEQEQWDLGTASADVVSVGTCAQIIMLRGLLTAPAYEALHRRMARDRSRHQVLLLADAVTFAATNRSLAEAATRVTPTRTARPVVLLVPAARVPWAVRHAQIMKEYGASRLVQLASLPGQAPAKEAQAATGIDPRVH